MLGPLYTTFNPFLWPFSATYAYFTVVLCVESTSLHMWVLQHFYPHNVLFLDNFRTPYHLCMFLKLSIFFQALAKLIFLINYFLPLLLFAFVFQIEHTVGLDICLGKGYFYFFSTQSDICFYDSKYSKGACWSLLILYAIGSSNILDAYVIFCCVKEIKRSTEKAKKSIGLQNYINRKRSKIAEAWKWYF